MGKCRVVVLYGHSLFAAGVESRLKEKQELEVVGIDAGSQDAMQRIKSLRPEAIILDGSDISLEPLLSVARLLKEIPGARVISLDLASREVNIFYSEQRVATRAEDLIEAIQMVSRHGRPASSGSGSAMTE